MHSRLEIFHAVLSISDQLIEISNESLEKENLMLGFLSIPFANV